MISHYLSSSYSFIFISFNQTRCLLMLALQMGCLGITSRKLGMLSLLRPSLSFISVFLIAFLSCCKKISLLLLLFYGYLFRFVTICWRKISYILSGPSREWTKHKYRINFHIHNFNSLYIYTLNTFTFRLFKYNIHVTCLWFEITVSH